MSHKVYARVAGSLVQVGEVFSYEQTEHVERLGIRLDLIPVDGVLSIELRHDEASHAVLRVVNIAQGETNQTAVPKITAIKAYREISGLGLGEAKAWLEGHAGPVERKGGGPWGRSAWDYDLPKEIVERLTRDSTIPRKGSPAYSVGAIPSWQVIFS